jgi:hypothetical protein
VLRVGLSTRTGARSQPGLPSAAQPLFILAMDQRDSFQHTLFHVTGAPSPDQLAAMRAAMPVEVSGGDRLAFEYGLTGKPSSGRRWPGLIRAAQSCPPGWPRPSSRRSTRSGRASTVGADDAAELADAVDADPPPAAAWKRLPR